MATRTIVISGVSRGLGLAMTTGFADREHTVVGCSRSPEAIKQLRDRFGAPHCFDVVDVADEQQVRLWASNVLATMGPPDLLVNNAL